MQVKSSGLWSEAGRRAKDWQRKVTVIECNTCKVPARGLKHKPSGKQAGCYRGSLG